MGYPRGRDVGLDNVGVTEWEGCGIKVWLVESLGNGRVIAFG